MLPIEIWFKPILHICKQIKWGMHLMWWREKLFKEIYIRIRIPNKVVKMWISRKKWLIFQFSSNLCNMKKEINKIIEALNKYTLFDILS